MVKTGEQMKRDMTMLDTDPQLAEERLKEYSKVWDTEDDDNFGIQEHLMKKKALAMNIVSDHRKKQLRQRFCDHMQAIMKMGGAESLINDDNGHWAVVADGIQCAIAGRKAVDVTTSFFVEAKDFSNTIEGALLKWAKDVLKH